MIRHRFGAALAAVLFAAIFLGPIHVASAGQRRAVPPGGQGLVRVVQAQAGAQVHRLVATGETEGAAETRRRLDALLAQYPPSLGRILKLDPTLLSNQNYLSPYPELAAFLAGHPEIARDPRYFLEDVDIGGQYRPDPKEQEVMMWRSFIDGTAIFLVFLVITGAIIWLVRALIEHRRWLRSSKMQVEMHGKLFDRFSNSEELLAYVQSPAGRRFFETAPISLDLGARDVGMPVRRILWAVQVGLVLAAGGCGLLIVSARAIDQMRQPLSALGIVVVSLGIGFVISAAVSFVLARRMGVLADRRPPVAGA